MISFDQRVNVSDIGNLTSIDVYRLDHYKYQFNNVIIVLDTYTISRDSVYFLFYISCK